MTAPGTFTKEQFWAELDALGEEEVRVRVVTKRYGNASAKRSLAEEWLRSKDQEHKDSSAAEQIAVARDAANAARDAADSARDNVSAARDAADAAWVAAREAKTANKIAKAAVIMAMIAIIVSIVSMLV